MINCFVQVISGFNNVQFVGENWGKSTKNKRLTIIELCKTRCRRSYTDKCHKMLFSATSLIINSYYEDGDIHTHSLDCNLPLQRY